jgi:glycosyltransferase involved in cell wall biosynthesis
MKLVLILMIKNEEKILKRCLEAVENVVDAFCICDTGSTDATKDIALEFLKTHEGSLSEEPFKDFGYNRTMSFIAAKKFCEMSKYDLSSTYGLLLDADMMFVPGKLKQQNLTESGYRIIQKNGGLEYYNARIIRMDYDWKCVGVTHEYWAGPADHNLEKDICFIDDKNDGGCKSDKFQRDARLLEKGLIDEPTNERYLFYLAQTYKCLGRCKDSIDMYMKRIEAGGWAEEVWFSYYSIAHCYKMMSNHIDFEKWMQLAYSFRPCRAEPLYQLSEFFRINSQHYKSYQYIKLGQKIPYPKDDVLFIEANVYQGLFDYEASIIEYYIHPEKGLRTSMNAMLKTYEYQQNIVSNLKFYAKPLKSTIEKLTLPKPFGDDFNPSAISVCEYPMCNIRYINYLPPKDGSYITRDGSPIQTRNIYINLESGDFTVMQEPTAKFKSNVKGLEDLRLYKNNDTLMFTATSFKEFAEDKVLIVHGEYDSTNKTYNNFESIDSPTNSNCEKNWVNVPGTDHFIYSFNPFRIGKIRGNKFYFFKQINTKPFFSLLRGSAPPIDVNGKWWILTHFVEYSQPRKYYHCFIEVEKETYRILKVSLPFVFQGVGIEYCISVRLLENEILEYYTSFTDTDPSRVKSSISHLEWIDM